MIATRSHGFPKPLSRVRRFQAVASTAMLAAGLSACGDRDSSPGNCASITVLTASIGGQVYSIPATDTPIPDARDKAEIVRPDYGRSQRGEPVLSYCQVSKEHPVELLSVAVAPSALRETVDLIMIEDGTRDAGQSPAARHVMRGDWRLGEPSDQSIPGKEFPVLLDSSGNKLQLRCPAPPAIRSGGPYRYPTCDTRVRLETGGVVYIRFFRPAKLGESIATVRAGLNYTDQLKAK